MRIAFLAWEYPPVLVGGLGTYAENMTRKYVELGHDVCVFALNTGELPTREIIKGVEVHRPKVVNTSRVFPLLSRDLGSWGSDVKFFSDLFMYNALAACKLANRLIRKEGYEFDMICYHDWLNSIAGMTLKDEINIPTVFHAHSTEWGRTGDGSEIIKALERESAMSSDGIITVSYAMKSDLTTHGWPEEKIHVIWNGVNPERYDPDKIDREGVIRLRDRYGLREDQPMILFVGRLTWVKGIRNLIQAMPTVLSEHPDAKLVILGRGEEQGDITELASRLGISDSMHYRFEFIPEDERILHYAAADLCVFPSTYEPFGIVSLEAMSMEKPLVVGAKGVVGFREQVMPEGPDQNGVHVDGNSPTDISWGLRSVLSNREKAAEWGRNGRKRVLRYFTWDEAAKHTLASYQFIMDRRRQG